MRAIILMLGTALWAISEILELMSGGFNDINSSVSVAAFATIGIGLIAHLDIARRHYIGRVGLLAVAFGMIIFAVVAYQTIGSGITSDVALSGTTLFLTASNLVGIGALALSYWLITASPYPKLLGIVLLAGTALSIGVAFLPALIGLQPISNLVLAATLFWFAWLVQEDRKRRV